MDYIQLTLDDYIQCKNEIKTELGGIVKSFVRIGWQLSRIDRSEAYKNDGYSSITEFAKKEYEMNPSGVSRFIKVYEKYSEDGDTPALKEQYKEFKFTQLVEMLQLPEEDRLIFHPEDKREDIRELQKFNRENENNPDRLLDWKTAESKEEKVKAAIQELFREKQGLLNQLYSSEAYQKGDIKKMAEIVNHGDSMSYRKGIVFLMFHTNEVVVKIFGENSEVITWDQFFGIVQGIFGEAAAGNRTYENYFGIAPAQKDQEKAQDIKTEPASQNGQAEPKPKEPINELQKQEKSQKTDIEEQLPGQDSIENHPEYMPRPVKTEEYQKEPEETDISEEPDTQEEADQPKEPEILGKSKTRKEYLDSLTAYGAAAYLARQLPEHKTDIGRYVFWEAWMIEKVDENGNSWD